MIVKLLTEHDLAFLSLKGGCKGSSESTLVKLLEISCRGSFYNATHVSVLGPRRDKTFLRGFRQSETQTSLLRYRD